jgi:protein tyrosine/serine phosphatase
MLTPNDLATVYDFIKQTGESNIKKMMTNGKMTATHVGLLLKVIRNSKVEEFAKYYETNSFPKTKYSNEEDKLKEKFWETAVDSFVGLGLAAHVKAA